jgi:hypothetical protein
MAISARRKGYKYLMKHHDVVVMAVVLIHAHPLKCIASGTVHHAPVIQIVKQIVQLF